MTVNRGSHGSSEVTTGDVALPLHSSQPADTTDLFGNVNSLDNFEPLDEAGSAGQGPSSIVGEISSSVVSPVLDVGSDTVCNHISIGEHNAWFAHSLLTNVDLVSVKLPWEQGIFAELLNDGDGLPDVVPKIEISTQAQFNDLSVALEACRAEISEAAQPSCASGDGAIYPSFVKSISDKDYAAKRSSLMDAAIKKLLIVLRHCMLASVAGRQILASKGGETEEEAVRILTAIVGVKSPATVVKRANSLLSYLRWAARQLPCEVNPFEEQHIWAYFSWLKEVGAAATRASSCLSAIRFGVHVLGMETLVPCLHSRRLTGLSEILLAGKPLLKQATPLTVNQVLLIHKALNDVGKHPYDRAFSAYCLIALYGRCRHSDLQCIHSAKLDIGKGCSFLEITASNHKTGRSAEKKSQLLPILIPGIGVNGEQWLASACQALERVGAPLDEVLEGPLLPAPDQEPGMLLKRGLTSSETTGMLRAVTLSLDQINSDGRFEVSSHSLKSTTLSWCAKYGLSGATRSILGRHSGSLVDTYTIYSRDLTVAPTRELQSVIVEISEGRFMPDAPGRDFFPAFPPEPPAAPLREECGDPDLAEVVCKHEDHPELAIGEEIIISSDESDSSSESEAESSASSALEEPPTKVRRFRPKVPADELWYVHRKSHILHRHEQGDEGWSVRFLSCGKRLTDAYSRSTESSAWNVICKMCAKKM